MNLLKYFFTTAIMSFSLSLQARVFDMNKESVASYFRGGYGLSTIGKSAFEDSSGADMSFNGEVKNTYNGEFGFVFTGSKVSFRLGFEYLGPSAVITQAKNNSGVVMYKLNSNISALVPKAGLEVNLKQTSLWRVFFLGSFGQATVKLTNKYEFTSDGLAQFPGMSNYTEDARGITNLTDLAFGFEGLMSDTTTYLLEAGYRQCELNKLKHNESYTTFNGAVDKGAIARNEDDSKKTLSLTGAYVSIGFRFYLN